MLRKTLKFQAYLYVPSSKFCSCCLWAPVVSVYFIFISETLFFFLFFKSHLGTCIFVLSRLIQCLLFKSSIWPVGLFKVLTIAEQLTVLCQSLPIQYKCQLQKVNTRHVEGLSMTRKANMDLSFKGLPSEK